MPKLVVQADLDYGASSDVCGSQSITAIHTSTGGDVSNWIGLTSGSLDLTMTAETNSVAGAQYTLIATYTLDDYAGSVTDVDIQFSFYLCEIDTINMQDNYYGSFNVIQAVGDYIYRLGEKSVFVYISRPTVTSPAQCNGLFESTGIQVITEDPSTSAISITAKSDGWYMITFGPLPNTTSGKNKIGTYAMTAT